MPSHLLKKRKFGWIWLFMLPALSLGGCAIIPIPEDHYWNQTRQNISPETVAFITPGQTTKEDVILRLGEPEEISDDGSRLAYFWFKTKGSIIFYLVAGAVVANIDYQYIFSITFDEKNLASGKGFYERRISGDRLKLNPESAEKERIGWRIERIDRYLVESENRDFKKIINEKKINIGPFTSSNPGQADFGCKSMGSIKTPGNEAYSMYVRKALISELDHLSAFSPQAEVTLSANLDRIDYDSSEKKHFSLMITVNSSNGKSLAVRGKYEIPGSPGLFDASCQDLARAFRPAVQNLIGNLIRSPEFPVLITPPDANQGK
jgi:hypothetical protein